MVRGEVFHALRSTGATKDEAKDAARQVVEWMRVLPEVPENRHRDPRLNALTMDRAALAQALAFAWLTQRNT